MVLLPCFAWARMGRRPMCIPCISWLAGWCLQVFGYIQTRLVQGKEEGHTIQVGGQHVQLGIPQVRPPHPDTGVEAASSGLCASGNGQRLPLPWWNTSTHAHASLHHTSITGNAPHMLQGIAAKQCPL